MIIGPATIIPAHTLLVYDKVTNELLGRIVELNTETGRAKIRNDKGDIVFYPGEVRVELPMAKYWLRQLGNPPEDIAKLMSEGMEE